MTIENKLSDFIFKQLEQSNSSDKVGLLDGITGESLYYFYRSEFLNDEASYDIALEKLNKVIEIISSTSSNSSFYDGIAGIGWFITHLNNTGIAEIAIEDFLDSSVDNFLYEDMIKHLNKGVYDFFFGASGICFYFLHRYATTENEYLKETYKTYITHFLFYMEYISITDSNGIHWRLPSYPFKDDRMEYQLSSLSNISAIILILSEIINLKDFNPIAVPMIKKSSNWLVHQLAQSENIRIDQAFCLWKTSKVLKDKNLNKISLDFIKKAANKVSQKNFISLNKLVLIFKKISQETNDSFFEEKTKEYFQLLTNQFSDEKLNDYGVWKGYAGIGLTDISFKHQLNTNWTNCILI